MYARSTTLTGAPATIDDGIAHVCDEVMPAITAMPGCMGMSMLADRATGRCIVTSSWRDLAAMRGEERPRTSLASTDGGFFGRLRGAFKGR